MRLAPLLAVVVAGSALMAGSAAVLGVRAPAVPFAIEPAGIEPLWTEIKWPFPIDQWGVGRAFVCAPANCGSEVDVYVRPKIGYCNCSTGVSDDAELERVSDTELVSREVQALSAGQPIKVGWMEGRIRPYRMAGATPGRRLLSMGYNDECDVVVAVATLDNSDPAVIGGAVTAFLNSTPMVLWAKKELGLEFVSRQW